MTRPGLLLSSMLLMACASGCKDDPKPAKTPDRTTWPTIAAEAAKLDAAGLQAFAQVVGGNGVVVRHDAIAFTWGNPRRALDVASASKPVMVHFVLKAVESGKIPSLDEPVVKWLPALSSLNAALDHKDAKITWRHLINQTSCYGVTEAPGTAFDYNDFQTMLLWSLIYEKANETTADEVTEKVLLPQLFELIGAEDKPSLRIRGAANSSGRLVISPRDFARLGAVYLHGGHWGDKQIISAEHVKLALSTPVTVPRTQGKDAEMLPDAKSYGGGKNQEEHLGCYSFMWWLNTDRKLWPSVPADAFAAVGNGGIKVMMVIPSLDLIISWNDAKMKPLPLCTTGKVQMEAVLRPLMAAVK